MRTITHSLLARYQHKPGPVLELGCGSGLFLQGLSQRRPHQLCVGVDRSATALGYAADHQSLYLTQADLQQLPFPNNHFALVVALDVFDQRRVSLQHAIRESWRVLQPEGILLLRLSAHRWLHSVHDRAFNTGRRYQRQEVAAALHANGFAIERMTYANLLLAPPIILQRLLQRWRLLPFSSSHTITPAINEQIARALQWEAHLLRTINLPFGISLYALARKRL